MTNANYPREIPPLWLLVSIGAMLALHFTVPLAIWITDPWRNLGYVPFAFGVLLVLMCARRFQRAGTGIRPFSEVTAVVREGPFRWTRNPMYLGLVTVAVGVAIRLGSASPMLVPVVLFFVLDRRFVRREEEFLRQSQGTPYDDYCASVRRWL